MQLKLNINNNENCNNFKRSFEIIAVLKDNLPSHDKNFINNIIQELMNKYYLKRDNDGIIYREQQKQYDDFIPCTSFYLDLVEFKKYFDILEYNSYLEGVMHGSL
ncbi:MAG: hypothetical protein ACI4EU_02080 [Butyrivibrio sp.]